MDDGRTMQRPGGRSARVRAAVHAAVLELLETHPWEELSVPLVATESGVHQATIYRRWGTMSALLHDVVDEWSTTTASLPDTGALHDDLHRYAAAVATSLRHGNVPLILRAVVMEIRPGQQRRRSPAFAERERQLQAMLDRAQQRGEPAPTLADLVELVVAPLYFHALFTEPMTDAEAARLVDRLLDIVTQRSSTASATRA
ncbi:TetR-like C-terminal domain-containing protein [Nocardia suismassiliense]|uniref:TetR-like C-terminal domain-containing protein n=1 Tax=Nocardia suismassiliense TaxID=2077092 RepID=UPI00131EE6F4|nr:TetR-like C-terminal domain-containing protein [Nocardia suismassiliense]